MCSFTNTRRSVGDPPPPSESHVDFVKRDARIFLPPGAGYHSYDTGLSVNLPYSYNILKTKHMATYNALIYDNKIKAS